MIAGRAAVVLLATCGALAHAADAPPIDATTAGGDRVRLFPNGRWEFVDAAKAAAQKPVVQAYDRQHDEAVAAEQGGLFGIGRKIKPGDPDYNRGSLSGKH